ncbi:MAG: AAA family ATPase, partial [Chloroflexota bacterium]
SSDLQSLMHSDASGVNLLAAPLQPEQAEEIGNEQVSQILKVMAQTFDYVVVDTPPQITDAVGSVLDQSTLVVVLTTQEVLALRRTKVLLQMMKGWGYSQDKVKLVVNHAYNVNGVAAGDIEAALDYPIFWDIPNDQIVSNALKVGKPFVLASPGSPASRNVVELARKVCGLHATQSGGGLADKFKFLRR